MPATTTLSIVGLWVWVGYELVLRRRDPETATWQGGRDDHGTTRLLFGAYAVSLIVNFVAGNRDIGMVPADVRWIGVAVLAAGLALRAWAMVVLRASYTRTVRSVAGQELVARGPYAVVRHPGYAGSLLVWIGYSLGLGSWVAAAVVAVVLTGAYVRRITVEEGVLRAAFADGWDAYASGTSRLVPGLW